MKQACVFIWGKARGRQRAREGEKKGREGVEMEKEVEGWTASENRASLAALMQHKQLWWLTRNTLLLIPYTLYIVTLIKRILWRHPLKTVYFLLLFFIIQQLILPPPFRGTREEGGCISRGNGWGGREWMWLREGQQHLLSSSQIHQAKQHSLYKWWTVRGTKKGEKEAQTKTKRL